METPTHTPPLHVEEDSWGQSTCKSNAMSSELLRHHHTAWQETDRQLRIRWQTRWYEGGSWHSQAGRRRCFVCFRLLGSTSTSTCSKILWFQSPNASEEKTQETKMPSYWCIKYVNLFPICYVQIKHLDGSTWKTLRGCNKTDGFTHQ